VKCLHNDIEHLMIHRHGMLCVFLEGDCSTFWHSRMTQSLPGALNIHSADAVFKKPYDLFCVIRPQLQAPIKPYTLTLYFSRPVCFV
jgi:hypothetical protein